MNNRCVGLWLIGACGGVGTTATLGLAALARNLTDTTSLVTALPMFETVELDAPAAFVVGGHEIRQAGFRATAAELHQRSNVFDAQTLAGCAEQLAQWEANLRPGTILGAGPTIGKLADRPEVGRATTARQAIEQIKRDLQAFREEQRLDQVVVINVSSTEPPVEANEALHSLAKLNAALDGNPLPSSSLYAYAALDLGLPYVNFTPSLGATCPALEELAQLRGTAVAGKDGKTGETLLKTVLAPMFKHRNWQILSWVGHNIFGNRDGLVLDDPVNKSSKIKTKDQVISGVVGYKPQTHVSIEYIESLDDWKTAWNHIHFKGFLGTKMIMQVIWQGCDSLLAGPLVVDLARLTLLAQRRGEVGVLKHLACFFKNPHGVAIHDFFEQFDMLEAYVAACKG
jgi:myo-inositol-1-phosphate synthase